MSSQVPNRRLQPQNTESKNLALPKDDTGTILLLSLVSFIFFSFSYFLLYVCGIQLYIQVCISMGIHACAHVYTRV